MSFIKQYLDETKKIIDLLDPSQIEDVLNIIIKVREDNGRLFILGVGGSAANAIHAINDFRKIAGIEAYSPMDNVSELTARINDDGWASAYSNWLLTSKLNQKDLLLVFSVGGGDLEKNISPNLVMAMQFAKSRNVKIAAIVGRDGGYANKIADALILIPTVHPERITPHVESFQSLICHLLISHPKLKISQTKWESTTELV